MVHIGHNALVPSEIYPNTRVIDCTEIFTKMLQQDTSTKSEWESFLNYKKYNTSNNHSTALMRISESDTDSFMPDLYSGRNSEKQSQNTLILFHYSHCWQYNGWEKV